MAEFVVLELFSGIGGNHYALKGEWSLMPTRIIANN
jgi:site-specific DNA-cytosine methylase